MDDELTDWKRLVDVRLDMLSCALTSGTVGESNKTQFMELLKEVHDLFIDIGQSLNESKMAQDTYGPELRTLLLKLGSEHGQSLPDMTQPSSDPANPQPDGNIEEAEQPKVEEKGIISRINKEEFERVPKYVRDRLPFDLMAPFVEQLDTVLTKKYNLLAKPRSAVSQQDMERIRVFRTQETDETKGLKFFVPADLKTFCAIPFDAKSKKLLAVLVYVKKLREIRGPGPLVRQPKIHPDAETLDD